MKYQVVNEKGKEIMSGSFSCKSGLNHWNLELTDKGKFNHMKTYFIYLTDRNRIKYTVPFIYINSIYLNK
ncbi:hypothetical protein D3C72_980660 [compost metagenome]